MIVLIARAHFDDYFLAFARKYVKITRQYKSPVPAVNFWRDSCVLIIYECMHREAKDFSLFMCNYFSVVLSPTCTLLLNFYSTAQVVETSVAVDKNSPIQDYFQPDDQTKFIFDSFHF